MSGEAVPTNYPAIVPYLIVADAPALMKFFEQAFGAATRYAAPGEGGKVMHAEMVLGEGLLMISDAAGAPGLAMQLCHYVADTDAVYATAIAAGAKMLSAPETKAYGQRIGGIQDPAGNTWWICQVIA